jgi:hypothetical protein
MHSIRVGNRHYMTHHIRSSYTRLQDNPHYRTQTL